MAIDGVLLHLEQVKKFDPRKSYPREPCAYERGQEVDNHLRASDQAPSTQSPRPKGHPRTHDQCKRRDAWAHVPLMPTWTQEQTHAYPRTSPMIQWGPILAHADRHALTNTGESIRRTHAHSRTYSHVYPKIRQHNTLNQLTSTTHVLAQKRWWWP